MTGNNPAPWPSGSIDLLKEPVVDIYYTVKLWTGTAENYVTVPASDVTVSLDATRVPFGEATFTTPPLPWDGVTWPAGDLSTLADVTWRTTPAEIRAGYSPDTMQVLLFGIVTGVHATRDTDDARIEWTVQSCEVQWEFPSHRKYDVDNGYTRVKQVTDAIQSGIDPWLSNPSIAEYSLNTPDAAQLSSFRSCEIEIRDSLGDFLRQCAQTLGQRLRPDWRQSASFAAIRYRIEPDPTVNTGGAYLIPTVIEQSETYGQSGGTLLNFTAQWYTSGGDEKSAAVLWWETPLNTPDGYLTNKYRVIPADATVAVKPPGGAIPSYPWPPAYLWLQRVKKQLSRHSVTARAAFWIQPFDAVTYPDITGNTLTIGIDAVTFNLADGTMTVEGCKA